MRRFLLVSLLTALLGGCVVLPWGYGHQDEDRYSGGSHQRWHEKSHWNDHRRRDHGD